MAQPGGRASPPGSAGGGPGLHLGSTCTRDPRLQRLIRTPSCRLGSLGYCDGRCFSDGAALRPATAIITRHLPSEPDTAHSCARNRQWATTMDYDGRRRTCASQDAGVAGHGDGAHLRETRQMMATEVSSTEKTAHHRASEGAELQCHQHSHAHAHAHAHAHMHTCTHACTCHMHMHTCTRAHMHVLMHMHMLMHMHVHVHVHVH